MAKKTSVQFYYDYIEQLQDLDDKQFRKVLEAMVIYDEMGETIKLEPMSKMAFNFIKKRIDYDKDTYNEKCQKNRQNIQNYWNERKRTNTNEYERIRTNTKNTDIDIELDIDKDLDKDNIITTTTNIYSYIEENFNRTLSPIEVEIIDEWLSLFNEDIIKYAIQISVINNAKRFNYVNKILENWKSSGYKTLQEIKENEKVRKETNSEKKELFDYNWLEESEE